LRIARRFVGGSKFVLTRSCLECSGSTPLFAPPLDAALALGGPASRPVESGVKPPHAKDAAGFGDPALQPAHGTS